MFYIVGMLAIKKSQNNFKNIKIILHAQQYSNIIILITKES